MSIGFGGCVRVAAVSAPLVFAALAAVGLTAALCKLTLEVQRGTRRERRRGAARSRRLASRLRDGERPFDLRHFLARVERAFLVVQESWSRQDPSAARPFLSDGVHERLLSHFEEQRAHGYRYDVRGARVEHMELLEVRRMDRLDVAAVRIDARAKELHVDLASGLPIGRTLRSGRFSEVWSFLRWTGACPSGGVGLLEGRCPSCAAPLEGGALEALRCGSCGTGLRGALRDWVLTGIRRLADWEPREKRPPPGLRALRARDADFTLEHLEDRAEVLFRRNADAERRGDIAGLVAVAAPDFAERRRAELAPREGRSFAADCAVAAVLPRGVVEQGGVVRALVELRFSAELFVVQPQGAPRPLHSPRRRADFRHLYVLERRADARSDIARCLLSAHCPRCGAPLERASRGDCGYCGEVLNDGHGDWILKDALPCESEAARSLLDRLPPVTRTDVASLGGPTRGGLLGWAAALALADRRFEAEENAALQGFAERLDVPVSELASLAAAAQRGDLRVLQPETPEQARAWLRILIDLALCDGALAGEEHALLGSLAQQSGVRPDELETWLAQRTP